MTNFAKNKRTIILGQIFIEYSSLQVKFYFKVVFYNWYFRHYRYFILCLIVWHIEILVKRNSKSLFLKTL